MKKWWKRLRAALGMGLIWGVIWGLVGGFVMEAIVDPHGRIGDMWPPFFAMLGFAAGGLFSVMLWISEGRRRFDQLSLPRLTGLGALGGLLMGGYAAANLNDTVPAWVRVAVLVGPPTLCAMSAASTLILARKAEARLSTPANVAELADGREKARLP
jgi:O-antigen/teichoic acid export membrane protein